MFELAVEESRLESHREPMSTGCARRLFNFRHFDCEDDLCEAIVAAWDRIELESLRNLISSMPTVV